MKRLIKENVRLRRLYYRFRLARAAGQSNESQILAKLSKGSPKTFVEFGFHPAEFNCAALARNTDWQGLLIDGSAEQVVDARALLPDRIKIVESFLSLDNLDFIKSAFPRIGVLSIDVDGNDYWFMERLIDANPEVICVEYNASLGLEPITVPYDPAFDRMKKHPTGWYHGASLTALAALAGRYGYGIAAVSEAGANLFFTQTGRLDPSAVWSPNRLRDEWSGKSASEQFEAIRDLPFVTI